MEIGDNVNIRVRNQGVVNLEKGRIIGKRNDRIKRK